MMKYLPDNRGFTLIEMLVAAAVSSVILLMVYTVYSSVIKSVNYGKTTSDYYESLNFALRRIDSDISNLYWKSDNTKLNFICTEQGGSSILNFVTAEYRDYRMMNNLKTEIPVTDIHEVGFYLKKNPDSSSYDLYRRCSIGYDESPLEGGTEELLLRKVKSIKFEFRYRSDWTPTWDTRENKRIPSVVNTTLIVYNNAGKEEQYSFLSIPNLGGE